MKKGFSTVTALLVIALIASTVGGLFNYNQTIQKANDRYESLLLETTNLGAFRPSNYVGKLLTRLDEGGSEVSFRTTPGTAKDGSSLTTAKLGDFIVFTINPGADNEEKISASAVSVSGTTATWTIINRGLSFTENAVVTANKKQHAVGETVIISNDDHYLSQQYLNSDDAQTISGLKTFSVGALFTTAASSTDECTLANEYCTKTYIDNSVNQGAATSTEANGGIAELATALEQASSTDLGVNKPLVLQTKYATDTPTYGCAVGYTGTAGAACGVIASLTGKIKQVWLNLTEAFTWTGLHTFNGGLIANNATTTSSFYISSITSSLLKTDSSGKVSAATAGSDYGLQKYSTASTTNMVSTGTAFATSTSVTVPAGVLNASSTVHVMASVSANVSNQTSVSCTFYVRDSTGATYFSQALTVSNAGGSDTRNSSFYGTIFANNSTSAQVSVGGGTNGPGSSSAGGGAFQIESSSSLNWSQARTFMLVSGGDNANLTCTTQNFSIEVKP